MAENGRLTVNQHKAMEALLSCPSVRAAAERALLSERTMYRYLGDGGFRAELRRRQDQVMAATTAGLVGMSGHALTVLRDILTGEGASDNVKVRAALGWLRHQRDIMELQDLAERVQRLEETLR